MVLFPPLIESSFHIAVCHCAIISIHHYIIYIVTILSESKGFNNTCKATVSLSFAPFFFMRTVYWISRFQLTLNQPGGIS